MRAKMAAIKIDVDREYAKNKSLRKEDVARLQEWNQKQDHLPNLSEFRLISFLRYSDYSLEMAKVRIEKYFKIKDGWPELFKNRDPNDDSFKSAQDFSMHTALPIPTAEGYRVFYSRLLEKDRPDKFDLTMQMKRIDMVRHLALCQNGTSNGYVILIDMQDVTIDYLTKLSIMPIKKSAYALEGAFKLRSMHVINSFNIASKLMTFLKAIVQTNIMNKIYVHKDLETLYEFVPKECLPDEYGGKAGTIKQLHEKQKAILRENASLLVEEEREVADMSKWPKKAYNFDDNFCVEGSFKQMCID